MNTKLVNQLALQGLSVNAASLEAPFPNEDLVVSI
jgi:hypothetical protein